MNSHRDNTNNKPIKDFLNSKKNPSEHPMDDFDREAMEGFNSLQNEEEVIELKNKLDARAYSEVFTQEKRSNRSYWYAAAGLFLVIGLSIYFVLNDPIPKKKELALETTLQTKDDIQKTPETQSEKETSDQPEKTSHTEITASEKKRDQPERSVTLAPKKALEQTEMQNKLSERKSADLSDQERVETSMEPPPPVASAGKINEGSTVLNAPVSVEDKQVAKAEDLAFNDQDVALEEVHVVQKETKEKKRAEKASVSRKSVPSVADGAASSSDDLSGQTGCYYSGGDDALLQELKKTLKEKGLLQKFDATLYISENGKVDQVTFTNSFDLNKVQQEKLKETLKGFDKFKFKNRPPKNTLGEYHLVFRP